MIRPGTISQYDPSWVKLAQQACLYLATVLGDYIEDVVLVGGLVPGVLINQSSLPPGAAEHAGTLDVDIALSLAVLSDERYAEISDRLRNAGFSVTYKDNGAAPTPECADRLRVIPNILNRLDFPLRFNELRPAASR